MIRVREWAVRPATDSPYTPPEHAGIRLSGKVYGHPEFRDGSKVDTSRVVAVDGRTITVESGRVYVLEGDPEPGYLKWLADNGRVYDSINPIVIKRTP